MGYGGWAKLNNSIQCTLSVRMLSWLYSTPGASLASVEVWRIEYSSPVAGNFGNTTHTHTKSHIEVGDPTGNPHKNLKSKKNNLEDILV